MHVLTVDDSTESSIFCLRSLIWIIRPDFLEQTCSLWNLGALKNNWNIVLVWIFYVFFVRLKSSSALFWLFSKTRWEFSSRQVFPLTFALLHQCRGSQQQIFFEIKLVYFDRFSSGDTSGIVPKSLDCIGRACLNKCILFLLSECYRWVYIPREPASVQLSTIVREA